MVRLTRLGKAAATYFELQIRTSKGDSHSLNRAFLIQSASTFNSIHRIPDRQRKFLFEKMGISPSLTRDDAMLAGQAPIYGLCGDELVGP
jgi:hypothetical protein